MCFSHFVCPNCNPTLVIARWDLGALPVSTRLMQLSDASFSSCPVVSGLQVLVQADVLGLEKMVRLSSCPVWERTDLLWWRVALCWDSSPLARISQATRHPEVWWKTQTERRQVTTKGKCPSLTLSCLVCWVVDRDEAHSLSCLSKCFSLAGWVLMTGGQSTSICYLCWQCSQENKPKNPGETFLLFPKDGMGTSATG